MAPLLRRPRRDVERPRPAVASHAAGGDEGGGRGRRRFLWTDGARRPRVVQGGSAHEHPEATHHEVVPQPVYGQAWAPGYWARAGQSWSWVGGRHIAARTGYAYYPGQWVVRTPGRYAYVPGFYRPSNRPPPRMPYRPYTGGARVQVYRP